jgi:hypothetical protein
MLHASLGTKTRATSASRAAYADVLPQPHLLQLLMPVRHTHCRLLSSHHPSKPSLQQQHRSRTCQQRHSFRTRLCPAWCPWPG